MQARERFRAEEVVVRRGEGQGDSVYADVAFVEEEEAERQQQQQQRFFHVSATFVRITELPQDPNTHTGPSNNTLVKLSHIEAIFEEVQQNTADLTCTQSL